jgi:DNA recombination protein RmuC
MELSHAWPLHAWQLAIAAGAALAVGFALGMLASRVGAGRARDAFAALAADALRGNAESFLALANERFQRLEESAESDWGVRRKALDDAVAPLREALDRYRVEAHELERTRAQRTGELGSELRELTAQTSRLSDALRGSAARGRWGELTLRRTAELAGLSEHCDFAEQVTLGGDGAAQRPDMIVRLPGGREVAVDAKAPLDAYWKASQASGDAERDAALDEHARSVRRHVDTLAARDYAARLECAPDFVVLFLPDEGFLASAAARDRALIEQALAKGVVLATPATLYALLSAVARGWRDARLEENTRVVLRHARALDERLALFVDHLAKVGASLSRSVEAYNSAIGSLEARVLPQARRMRELGAEGARPLEAPEPIAVAVRAPNATA